MLVNEQKETHVEFVAYDGKYPNLCSGTLFLKIDGEKYSFGNTRSWSDKEGQHIIYCTFGPFWSSGGCLDKDYEAIQAEWKINVEELPEQFRKYALEIDRVFNENVPFGCCGGCS